MRVRHVGPNELPGREVPSRTPTRRTTEVVLRVGAPQRRTAAPAAWPRRPVRPSAASPESGRSTIWLGDGPHHLPTGPFPANRGRVRPSGGRARPGEGFSGDGESRRRGGRRPLSRASRRHDSGRRLRDRPHRRPESGLGGGSLVVGPLAGGERDRVVPSGWPIREAGSSGPPSRTPRRTALFGQPTRRCPRPALSPLRHLAGRAVGSSAGGSAGRVDCEWTVEPIVTGRMTACRYESEARD